VVLPRLLADRVGLTADLRDAGVLPVPPARLPPQRNHAQETFLS
jgi:hypothetical protein